MTLVTPVSPKSEISSVLPTTLGAAVEELVPGTVVVAANAGVAKPTAEIDAPVRNAIRRERLVIV